MLRERHAERTPSSVSRSTASASATWATSASRRCGPSSARRSGKSTSCSSRSAAGQRSAEPRPPSSCVRSRRSSSFRCTTGGQLPGTAGRVPRCARRPGRTARDERDRRGGSPSPGGRAYRRAVRRAGRLDVKHDAERVPALDLTAVPAVEPRAHALSLHAPLDECDIRAAVDLRAGASLGNRLQGGEMSEEAAASATWVRVTASCRPAGQARARDWFADTAALRPDGDGKPILRCARRGGRAGEEDGQQDGGNERRSHAKRINRALLIGEASATRGSAHARVHVHPEGLCDLFGGYDACFDERSTWGSWRM
jgi:hypothetical protein